MRSVIVARTLSTSALAVTCTINGTVAVEPLDGYYCDTSAASNCTGWREQNLDQARGTNAKKLQYMRIEIWRANNTVYLAKAHTSSTGAYSVSFTLPGSTCSGQSVTIQHWMQRIHESDVQVWPPRYRFSITAYQAGVSESQMLAVWRVNQNVTLTGPTTAVAVTFGANTSLASRLANIYYTANSAIKEIVTWTTRLSGHFASTSGGNNGIFRLIYGPDNAGVGGAMNPWDWAVVLGYDAYNRGATIRHELGHAVREAMHDRTCQFIGCSTYDLNYSGNYFLDSCEYGSAAFNEGFANFIAVTSVTTHDTNAWICSCSDNANQDVCSELSNGTVSGDGRIDCGGLFTDFVAIGDRWVTSTAWCKKVRESLGCSGCTQDSNGFCTNGSLFGWRNVVQVTRFLWDLVDTSTDGGYDSIDYTMGGLISAIQGMPQGYGVDGSCRESERALPSECNPSTNGAPVTGGAGSRDAYDVRDISDLLPEDETWVRSINCVSLATDN